MCWPVTHALLPRSNRPLAVGHGNGGDCSHITPFAFHVPQGAELETPSLYYVDRILSRFVPCAIFDSIYLRIKAFYSFGLQYCLLCGVQSKGSVTSMLTKKHCSFLLWLNCRLRSLLNDSYAKIDLYHARRLVA